MILLAELDILCDVSHVICVLFTIQRLLLVVECIFPFLGGLKMLELRPNCELCDKDLPAESTEACICTYECTFCCHCVETVLNNVCPNCGGGFSPRPIRPKTERRSGVSLAHQPASTTRVNTKYSKQEIMDFSSNVKDINPVDR